MKYLVRWLELGKSNSGEASLDTLQQVRGYLEDQGYQGEIIESVLRDMSFVGECNVVTVEELHDKPVYIVMQHGLLRTMVRPHAGVEKIFECRTQEVANHVLKKTTKRVSKGKYAYPVRFHLGKGTPKNYWYDRWVTDVMCITDSPISLGDVKLLKARK